MMWTSYEALCEMGIATTMSAKGLDLDLTLIFGVIPSNLKNIPQSQGGYGPEVTATMAEAVDQSKPVDGSNSIYRHNVIIITDNKEDHRWKTGNFSGVCKKWGLNHIHHSIL